MHQNIPKTDWDPKSGMPRRLERNRDIRTYLEAMRSRAHAAFMELARTHEYVLPEMVAAAMFGRDEEGEVRTLLEVWDEHNDEVAQRVGKDVSKYLLQKHVTLRNYFQTYLRQRYKLTDLPLKLLKPKHVEEFHAYLLHDIGNAHNTALRQMLLMKKITIRALKARWMSQDPFEGLKFTFKKHDPLYLTDFELAALEQAKFKHNRHKKVRDWFLFSCYTGMAYSDVRQLRRSHLVMQNGVWWLRKPREKTGVKAQVPVLASAMEIILRHADIQELPPQQPLFTMMSNQKTNAYLKEIAEICGIPKALTFHAARHTFATTVTLQNGVSIETVSSMLGHSSIRMTEHYARIVDSKVATEMAAMATRTNQSLAS